MYSRFVSTLLISAALVTSAHADLTPPRVANTVTPEYPESLREKGVKASVVVKFEVTETGGVRAVTLAKSSGHNALDKSALAAAKKLRFTPARDETGAVPVEITYTFSFAPPARINFGQLTLTLVERGTRSAAGGVQVAIVGSKDNDFSAVSDASGKVVFTKVPADNYQIIIKAPGYRALESSQDIKANEEVSARYLVERESYDQYVTVVEDKRVEEVSRRVLRPNEIYRAAGTAGDPIRIVQNLPGVARGAFGSGQLSIRGAAPFESRFFFDDLEVPILFHFGGIRTAYNGEVIDRVDFLPGGYTGRYGNAVGGIVSTYTRSPRKDRYHLLADINTYDSQLLIEGPVAKNLSFYVSARRSYIDVILNALLKDEEGFSLLVAPRYYDYQVALEWQPSPRDKRTLQIYGSDDTLEFLLDEPIDRDPALRGNFKTNTYFHRLALHWQKGLDNNWTSNTRLGAGPTGLLFDTSNGPYLKIRTIENVFRQELTKDVSEKFSYTLGATTDVSPYLVTARVPPPNFDEGGVGSSLSTVSYIDATERGTVADGALFGVVTWRPGHLTLIPSLRVDAGTTGTDVTVDPRLSARYKISDLDSAKASVGLYHQRPLPQESSRAFGNPDIESKYAIQYVLGYEREIPWRAIPLALDAQLFYRDLHRQIVATSGSQRYDNSGSGYAAGSEVYLKYGHRENFNGWVSYTLSKSVIRERDNDPFHPFQNDQTHILTFIGNIPLGNHWDFGFRFRYTTGNPYTPVSDSVYSGTGDAYIPIRGPLYSKRLPAFHQLDVRIDKRWVYDTWMLNLFLEIQNAYNRKNVEAINYSYDFRSQEFVTGLPIIPIFGVRGEF